MNNLKLNLSENYLGNNPENLKYFNQIFKYLPNSLNNLELDFYNNNLGDNTQDMKYIG